MDGQNFNNGSEQQPVSQTPEQPVFTQQQPVYQQPQYEQSAYQQPAYEQPVYQQGTVPAKNKAHGLSIAGLVIGIVSICLCCMNWVGALIGLVGLILAIIGQVKRKSGLGLAAIIVSAAGMVLGLAMLVFVLTNLTSILGEYGDYYYYY